MTVRPRKAAHNADDSRHGAPPENTFSNLGFEARHKVSAAKDGKLNLLMLDDGVPAGAQLC